MTTLELDANATCRCTHRAALHASTTTTTGDGIERYAYTGPCNASFCPCAAYRAATPPCVCGHPEGTHGDVGPHRPRGGCYEPDCRCLAFCDPRDVDDWEHNGAIPVHRPVDLFSPEQMMAWPEMQAIARALGIDPEQVRS